MMNMFVVIVCEDLVLVNLGVCIIICVEYVLLLELDMMMLMNFFEAWT